MTHYIGVDLSLTATGVVVLNQETEIVEQILETTLPKNALSIESLVWFKV